MPDTPRKYLHTAEDGITRCWWGSDHLDYRCYHDDEFGSLAAYIWEWEPASAEPHVGKGGEGNPRPSITKTSQALSKDLKKRGWKFFGPTTAYAFMQAMGLVNDHIEGCDSRERVELLRCDVVVPVR